MPSSKTWLLFIHWLKGGVAGIGDTHKHTKSHASRSQFNFERIKLSRKSSVWLYLAVNLIYPRVPSVSPTDGERERHFCEGTQGAFDKKHQFWVTEGNRSERLVLREDGECSCAFNAHTYDPNRTLGCLLVLLLLLTSLDA